MSVQAIRALFSQKVEENYEKPVISLFEPGQKASVYIDGEKFNEVYYNFLKIKLANDIENCPDNFITKAKNAMNIIYLDGDYHFNKETDDDIRLDYETVKEQDEAIKEHHKQTTDRILKAHLAVWHKVLAEEGYDIAYEFHFIPEDITTEKGGHHVFITLTKEFSKTERARAINRVTKLLEADQSLAGFLSQNTEEGPGMISKIFDACPITQASPNLLYSRKSTTSRAYKMIHTTFVDNGLDNFIGIIPRDIKSFGDNTVANSITCAGHEFTSKLAMYLLKHDAEIRASVESNANGISPSDHEKIFENVDSYTHEDKVDRPDFWDDRYDPDDEFFKAFGSCVCTTLKFVRSLAYLEPTHKLIKLFEDHNKRLTKFLNPLMGFLYCNALIQTRRHVTDKYRKLLCSRTVHALLPILKRTVKDPNDDTKRDQYDSCLQMVETAYNFAVKRLNGMQRKAVIAYWNCSQADKKNFRPIVSADIDALVEDHDDTEEDSSALDGKPWLKYGLSFINRALDVLKRMYLDWIECVNKLIVNGITTEIEPFEEQRIIERASPNPRLGVNFLDYVDKQYEDDYNQNFYKTILKRWIKMFIFILYIDSESTTEVISKIVKVFFRYYIWCRQCDTADNIYIYNIRQCRGLISYPYNQWINDNKGENLKHWLMSFYEDYIMPCLLRTGKGDITQFLTNGKMIGFTCSERDEVKLKVIPHVGNGINSIFNNLVHAFSVGEGAPIEPVFVDNTQGMFFPCHNGILDFKQDGTVEFVTNNRHRYTNGFTNINFEFNYNYDNKFFKAISTMWKQTFPIEDERLYVQNMISSCLIGWGQKDQFLVLYGTGGDGKTTFCNAIQSMLGMTCGGNASYVDEENRTHYFKNPRGLAASMKTETILVTKSGGHDEGGKIELQGARFCTIQEPDQGISGGKLNCSTIKELYSGAPISARKIFKGSQTFTPNALIILQTNSVPSYTEDTDAVRRRISLVPMHSKFTTNINRDELSRLEHSYVANPEFANGIMTDPRYWTALFMSLLPYCRELIKSKCIPISNIDRPQSITDFTNNSFTTASGLMGHLNQYIVKRDGYCENLRDLIKHIIETDKHYRLTGRNSGSAKFFLQHPHEAKSKVEIENYMQVKYHCIYRIKQIPEFHLGKSMQIVKKPVLQEIKNKCEKGLFVSDDELVEQYFEEHSLSNIVATTVNDRHNAFLVGYQYVPPVDDEDSPIQIDSE